MTLDAGSRLGPYEILAAVGAGGMGEVYRARDTRLERTVAVKVLPAHLSDSPGMRERFEREARTISQLSHPHICAIYDVGHSNETAFLVMEYLEGETLAERLTTGPLSPEQTLDCGIEIADALDRAHRTGIVHRDLKPGNVMLTASGVKLLDFGLAKVFSPGTSQQNLTGLPTQANLTQEGTILGTLQYMAPEQLEAKHADARTDIFAFGALLYEMATGRKAFAGSSQASLIGAILHTEPSPISVLQPMSPPGLERVVKRCLAKQPERRWQSARDIGLELEEVREKPGGPAAEASPTPRRFRAAGWVAAALLLMALLASLFVRGRRDVAAPAYRMRFAIAPPADAAFQGMPAISPDGRKLAFVATTADGRDFLYLRPLDSLDARRLDGTEGASYPFWSPDGRSIAFFTHGKLAKIDASGGSPNILCDAPNPRGGSWGSRGTVVFSINAGGEIHRVGEGGGRSEGLPHLVAKLQETNRWPSFLPDGRHFLYFVLGADPKSSGTYLGSLDSKETRRIGSADGGGLYAAPGFLLFRSGDRLMGQRFDAEKRAVTGEAFPVVEQIRWNGVATAALAVSASDTGLLAYQTGGATASRLELYDRAGRELGAIGSPGAYWEPALSPDARRLAVARFDVEGVGGSIWTGDVGGGSLVRLSSQAPIAASPVWSADGRRIIYAAFPSGEVYVRDAGGAEPERMLFRAAPGFTPLDDWSHDGRLLFYDVIDWRRFHNDVWVRDMQSGQSRPALQANFSQYGARLSPDGRWLAYESVESGVSEIFVRSFPESRERRQVSSGGGSQPRWSADGRELYFISPDNKLMAVDVRTGTPFETGPPRALFQTRILPLIEARNHYDAAGTGDGQRFVVNSRRTEDASLPILVVSGWIPDKSD